MIKEKIVQRKVKIKTHHCDVCEKTLKRDLQCSQAICEYCGKELCNDCVEYETNNTGDYRTVYCKDCWDIVKKYHAIINSLENEIDKLYEKCERETRNNVKTK